MQILLGKVKSKYFLLFEHKLTSMKILYIHEIFLLYSDKIDWITVYMELASQHQNRTFKEVKKLWYLNPNLSLHLNTCHIIKHNNMKS